MQQNSNSSSDRKRPSNGQRVSSTLAPLHSAHKFYVLPSFPLPDVHDKTCPRKNHTSQESPARNQTRLPAPLSASNEAIMPHLPHHALALALALATLRRSRDVRLLLVLDGSLLEVLGSVGGGVLLLRGLGAGAGAAVDALLLGGGLAGGLGGAVGGVGFGLEALDFGLGFGDVL